MAYYHVASEEYEEGEDLLSLYWLEGERAYELAHKRWPDLREAVDYHIVYVHLWSNLEDALDMLRNYGGVLLVVDIPEGDVHITWDTIEDGHPMVYGYIPGEYVHVYRQEGGCV